MKNLTSLAATALLSLGLSLGTTAVHAQNRIAGAVQQGNGAYVQKTDRATCITSQLLGVPGLSNCLTMNQDKFLLTPSGNAMSVWTGTLPAGVAHPAQRLTYNSTWSETNNDGVTRTYDTVAVTDPSGAVKLTLTDKQNGNAKAKGKK